MLLAGIEEQLSPVGRVDELPRGLEVFVEELVALLAVNLYGNPFGPGVSELRDRETPVHEQGAAGAGARLRELLRGHHAEREAGIDGAGANPLGGCHSALDQRAEARCAREGQ